MLISEFKTKELGLTVTNDLPSAIKPAIGDVWLCNDGRLIVVTKIDDSAFGNIRGVHACINGEWLEPFIDLWPMVLLSMQASPLGRVRK